MTSISRNALPLAGTADPVSGSSVAKLCYASQPTFPIGVRRAAIPDTRHCSSAAFRHLAVVFRQRGLRRSGPCLGHDAFRHRLADQRRATRLHPRHAGHRGQRTGRPLRREPHLRRLCGGRCSLQCRLRLRRTGIAERAGLPFRRRTRAGRRLSAGHEAGGELGAATRRPRTGATGRHAHAGNRIAASDAAHRCRLAVAGGHFDLFAAGTCRRRGDRGARRRAAPQAARRRAAPQARSGFSGFRQPGLSRLGIRLLRPSMGAVRVLDHRADTRRAVGAADAHRLGSLRAGVRDHRHRRARLPARRGDFAACRQRTRGRHRAGPVGRDAASRFHCSRRCCPPGRCSP